MNAATRGRLCRLGYTLGLAALALGLAWGPALAGAPARPGPDRDASERAGDGGGLADSPRARALLDAARDYLPSDWRYPTSDRPVPPLLRTLLASTLPVTVREQPNEWTCGPASLGIVASATGCDRTEVELERLTHNTTEGADPEDLMDAARAMGLVAQDREGATVEDLCSALERGLPAVIDFQASYTPRDDPKDDWGHYSVVVAADAADLLIVDPSETNPAHLRIIPRAMLPAIWWDTTITTHRRFEGWMMTVRSRHGAP